MTPKSNCCKASRNYDDGLYYCDKCGMWDAKAAKPCDPAPSDHVPDATKLVEKPAEHPSNYRVDQALGFIEDTYEQNIKGETKIIRDYIRELEAERDILKEKLSLELRLANERKSELAALKSAPSVKGWVLVNGEIDHDTFCPYEESIRGRAALDNWTGEIKRAEIRLIEEEE